jgi:hypothetical protein
MRTIGLCISDTHAGFKLGLMNPEVRLYERDEIGNNVEYSPKPTPVQEYFWELLLYGCREAREFANGDPIVLMHFGDATHGDRYPKTLVSTEIADQPTIAVANMEPLFELPNVRSFRLVAGTDAHNFDDANAEKMIVDRLKLIYPEVNVGFVMQGLAHIDGIDIEYAHRGPWTGHRFHLKGNVAHQWLRDRMTQELLAGRTPPRLYGFGHFHEWLFVTETVSIGDMDYTSSLMIVPSFNFPNLWTIAQTQAKSTYTHGMVALEIVDGELVGSPRRFTMTTDVRTKEIL